MRRDEEKHTALISIHPEHAENILTGAKRFEFRRRFPKSVRRVVMYATMPVGRVVGEFDVAAHHETTPDEMWEKTAQHAGVDRGAFVAYFGARPTAHAIEVLEARRYAEPKTLADAAGIARAPQSFCYLRRR